jgi:hypothetical protein
MALTRRRFLKRFAAAGSVSLAYEATTGLGLLAAPSQTPFNLSGRVSGVRVVITVIIACSMLGRAGLLATWWPARRAVLTNPLESLKEG